jgi:hypothetical protein
MYDVAFRTAKKVTSIFEKKCRSVDGASNDEAESDIEPALLSCYDFAGGRWWQGYQRTRPARGSMVARLPAHTARAGVDGGWSTSS